MAKAIHRGTRLRTPKRPLSDADKLKYVREFVIENHLDWEAGEVDIVLRLYLHEGLDKAFEAARKFTENRERKRNTELLAQLMSTGAHGVVHSRSPGRIPLTEKQIKELNDSGSTIIGDKQCGIYKEYQGNRLSGEMYAGNPDGVETLKQYVNRVDGGVQRVDDADLPKDDPSIRDLFGGPNWRTRVAEYFGFR